MFKTFRPAPEEYGLPKWRIVCEHVFVLIALSLAVVFFFYGVLVTKICVANPHQQYPINNNRFILFTGFRCVAVLAGPFDYNRFALKII